MWVEGEVGRGGGWHFKVRAIKFGFSPQHTNSVEHMFLQDVIHVCACHVMNLEHNFILAFVYRFIPSISSFLPLVSLKLHISVAHCSLQQSL